MIIFQSTRFPRFTTMDPERGNMGETQETREFKKISLVTKELKTITKELKKLGSGPATGEEERVARNRLFQRISVCVGLMGGNPALFNNRNPPEHEQQPELLPEW